MSDLKSWFQDQPEAVDRHEPAENLWDGVERKLKKQQHTLLTVQRIKKWAVAASIGLVVGLGAFFMAQQTSNKNSGSPLTTTNSVENWAQKYQQAVDYKLTAVQALAPEEEVLEELEILAEEYKTLESELGQSVNKKVILEAMQANYRLRLQILEEVMLELDKAAEVDETMEVAI